MRLLLILLLASSAEAAEEPVDQRELARTLFRDGTDEYTAGRYREAARHFGEAYALTALPGLLFNQAQALRLVFETEHDRSAGQRAVQLYDRYLEINNLSAADRKEPTERRALLARTLAPPPTAPPPKRRVGLWVGVGVGAVVIAGALAVGLGVGLTANSAAPPSVTPRW